MKFIYIKFKIYFYSIKFINKTKHKESVKVYLDHLTNLGGRDAEVREMKTSTASAFGIVGSA